MSAPSKIQQFIETGIGPRLKEVQKGHDEQLPGLTELANQLLEATKKPDQEKIQRLLAALKTQIEYAGKLVIAARNLQQTLGKVSLEGATPDDQKQVEQVKKEVADLEGKLQRNFGKLKGIEDEANNALDKIEQSKGDVAGDWAVLEGLVKDHLADAKTRLQQSTSEFDKFEKARAQRDHAGLDKARACLAKLITGSPTQAETQREYDKLAEKAKGNGLEAHAKEELQRELPALKKSLDEAEEIEAKITKFNSDAQGRGFAPVDATRAAKVLQITARSAIPKIQAALALGSPGMEKALDALAKDKEVKSKLSGKEMVEQLRKAKVI
jgi:hypothetical protein